MGGQKLHERTPVESVQRMVFSSAAGALFIPALPYYRFCGLSGGIFSSQTLQLYTTIPYPSEESALSKLAVTLHADKRRA